MKKILIILSLFCYSNHLIAQIMVGEPYYFCALNGSCYNDTDRKVTFEENEYTPAEIIYQTELFQNAHPEFEIIEPTSMRYNCHGYTHSVYHGGEKLFIQWEEELCNDAFFEIADTNNLQYGDIAVIRKTDGHGGYDMTSEHSSIVVNNDTLISKWGNGPLTKHYKYDLINIKGFENDVAVYTYYRRVANTQINGSDTFNGSGTYTFAPDVEIESCTWSVEPAAMFQQSSGSGTVANLSYKSNLPYLAPKAVLTFTFGYDCDNHYTVKKEIDLAVPTMSISGEMTCDGFAIRENSTVTVTGRIKINENGKIIIKPGGKLVIDGGELTSVCSDKQWQGIEVWGIDSLHQNLSNGQYYQGILELKNGAAIENAICAVDLWNPLDEHSEGGIVWAEDAVFRNNDKAVRAINYSNYNPSSGVETHNVSHFRNCSFIIDSDYSGNNTFNSHVELNNIDGIKFYTCYFSVDDSISQQTSSTSAIYASSAGFTVTSECSLPLYPCPEENQQRSVFSGFDNAIYVSNNGASVRTFTVSGAEFRNNQRCIYANNTGYATVIKNNFYVGSNSPYNYGVYIENVMNFCIEENNFTSTKKANSYGLLVLNSPSYNEIYLNHFYNLHYGNIAGGLNVSVNDQNIGLTYICNTNEGNINDFGVTLHNRQAYIRLYQGSSTIAASNTFSATNYHFYNEGGSLIKYFYNGAANRPTRVLRVSSMAATNKHECESHYDVVIGGGGGVVMSVGKTDSLKKKYENYLMSINRLKGLTAYKIEKDTTQRIRQESQMSMLRRECLLAAGDIVRSNLNKEERDFKELREWIGKNDDISSDRMIIASYIQQKDFVNAIALAKTLPATYNLQGAELDEHLDYMEIIGLHESLHETQRSVKQLTDYEVAMLEDISKNGVGGSQLMARSILDESKGAPTIAISSCPTIPTYGASVRGESEEITEPTSDKGLKVEVSPNPATSSVEISYVLPEKEKTATFVLTNTLGINVIMTELEGNNGVATINLGNIPSGIYFYTVRSGDEIMTGKLMKK